MAPPKALVERVRDTLADRDDVAERPMMGGIVFLVGGHMCCGVDRRGLMVRVGPAAYEAALDEPDASVMDITGRPMRGFVLVDVSSSASEERLKQWVARGVAFASGLPPKGPTR